MDFCYDYEKQLADEARLEEDYFRKRIPVIMMLYTLVRMVLRSLCVSERCENTLKG